MTVTDTVRAEFTFFAPPLDGAHAYSIVEWVPDSGIPRTNSVQEKHKVQVDNLRGKEHTVTLDTAGFQFFRRAATHTAFVDDEAVKREYYPESIDFVKDITGASRVVVFDHTIRRRNPAEDGFLPSNRQPATIVHVDQTPAAAVARVHRHLPAEDVPALLARRFQIINLWRPIAHAALDWPLALCDFHSVDPARDLAPVTLKYPDRDGETFGVKHSSDQKWTYLRGMEPEEFVLIKCYDSKEGWHNSLRIPHSPTRAPRKTPCSESPSSFAC
ncbi:Uncharacterized protein in dcmA 3'region [Grifola frondosa]|uniref:Uncharacterized protein in dcmA 3'region n=1 Tax=Grifola frondosa TaxID=5627 RepID=A0A1C7LT56_GRIFR|nr:Uncharacterized protein in dcmA 3'region [Grifola frondosa]